MSSYRGERMSMAHRSHPLIGRRVADTARDGKIGILAAVAPEYDGNNYPQFIPAWPGHVQPEPEPVAWIRPIGGGIEWSTLLNRIELA